MSDGDDIDDDNTVGGCVSTANNLDDTGKDGSSHRRSSNIGTGSDRIVDCSSDRGSNDDGGSNDGNGSGGHGSNWWMLAYLLVTLGYLGLICSRALLSAGGSLKASTAVHRGMLRRVLKAPVAW